MADIVATLATIATGLRTISGLNVHADGLWPDSVNPPAALIAPEGEADLSLDMSATTQRIKLIVVVKGGGGYESAQTALLPYCANSGAKSVRAALRTALGSALLTANRRDYGNFEIGGALHAGASWDLEVICQ